LGHRRRVRGLLGLADSTSFSSARAGTRSVLHRWLTEDWLSLGREKLGRLPPGGGAAHL